MSNLDTLILERIKRGELPVDIAYALEIPVDWVYEAEKFNQLSSTNVVDQ